eukprot:scaffold529_cov308-Pinguiococcus_pyrenoidosus.AAC.94
MNVFYGRGREVVVDHHVDAFEVHPPRHEVGADEQPDVASSESLDGRVSLCLRPAGVHDPHTEAIVSELLEKALRAVLRLQEEEHGRAESRLDELPQRNDLAFLLPNEHQLLLYRVRAGTRLADLHVHRVAEDRFAEFPDLRADRRREQSPLRRAPTRVKHLVDLRKKRSTRNSAAIFPVVLVAITLISPPLWSSFLIVEKPIRLVEHQCPYVSKIEASRAQHADESHGGRHDDIRFLQRSISSFRRGSGRGRLGFSEQHDLHLPLRHQHPLSQAHALSENLRRKLPGGRQEHGERVAGALALLSHLRQDGQHEGRRLSRAGRCCCEHVSAGQNGRNGLHLYRCRLLPVTLLHIAQKSLDTSIGALPGHLLEGGGHCRSCTADFHFDFQATPQLHALLRVLFPPQTRFPSLARAG